MKALALVRMTCVLCVVLLWSVPTLGQAESRALLDRAERAHAEGIELLDTDPDGGNARLAESVAAYRGLIETGHENASIHRNIGNVYLRTGDLGRAVASFRRAQQIDPRDPLVSDSLRAARDLVRTEVATGSGERVGDAVLFWRGFVPRSVLLITGLAAWAIAWGAGSLRLFTRKGALPSMVFGVVSVLCLGSLGLERTLSEINRHAVIVGGAAQAFRGPSESVYEPAFEQPLEPGVEARLLETRDGWVRLRLRSGAEAWVPETAIEEI